MQPHHRFGATRLRSASGTHAELMRSSSGKASGNAKKHSDHESDIRRSNTTGRRVGEGLKRRFGSLRRSKKTPEVNEAGDRFSLGS